MTGIQYGLKLWSSNTEFFENAAKIVKAGEFDFIELYANPEVPHDYEALNTLSGLPITLHATHSQGFHEFIIGEEQGRIWKDVIKLADFFGTSVIVVHPGKAHTITSFKKNLSLIDDPRIHIENMAGTDIFDFPMFGQKLSDLIEIRTLKPICFDFEKAVKAACFQNLDYKAYVLDCLNALRPTYFHISGGSSQSPVDEHLDLSEADFDLGWIKAEVTRVGGRLVFETPKKHALENDLRNAQYFKKL